MSAIPGNMVPPGTKLTSGGVRGPVGPALSGPQGEPGDKGSEGEKGDILLPAGFMAPYGGRTAPRHWLLCNGASYNVAAYPDLFAAIGYSFGGSGASFQVPDTRARTPVGAGGLDVEPGWAPWTGWKGGAPRHAITEAQMPHHGHQLHFDHYHAVGVHNHGHGFSQGWHDHGPHTHNVHVLGIFNVGVNSGSSPHVFIGLEWKPNTWVDLRTTGANWSGGSIAAAGNFGGWTNWVSEQAANWHWRGSAWMGGNGAHENAQPSLAVSFIIKT